MSESWKTTALLSIATAVLLVAVLEGLLHLLALAIPRVDLVLSTSLTSIPRTVPDRRLGHRLNPEYPWHDANGFRNPRVPARADVVALGDSQTYGSGVEAGAAWPRRLGELIGKLVYGMAAGGYGPAHSLILWDEAAVLRPGVIVEAFYAGNDLFDSFNLVYNQHQLPELRSADPEVRRRVQAAEQQEPIIRRVRAMSKMAPITDLFDAAPADSEAFSTRRLLARYSRLHGLARSVEREIKRVRDGYFRDPDSEWEESKRFAAAHPAYTRAFDDGRSRTVFTSPYRLSALDQTDPRIAEGRRISLEAIRRMGDKAAGRGIRFLVVMIPTKELVFKSSVLDPSEPFRSLTEHEERLWAVAVAFFEHHGIEYVDALPELREQLSIGQQPYPESRDGHPNRIGHQAIAAAVSRQLREAAAPLSDRRSRPGA